MKVHSPLYCITVDCAVLCQSTIPVFHFTLFIMMFLRSQTTSVFALWSFDSLTHQFFKFVDLFPILPMNFMRQQWLYKLLHLACSDKFQHVNKHKFNTLILLKTTKSPQYMSTYFFCKPWMAKLSFLYVTTFRLLRVQF